MIRARLSGPAYRDIAEILRHSGQVFGQLAGQRYRRLIDQAIQDLEENPSRVGVQAIDEIRDGYMAYHLKWSRNAAGSRVKQPRHLLAFYFDTPETILIARVLHERQMLNRHLPDKT